MLEKKVITEIMNEIDIKQTIGKRRLIVDSLKKINKYSYIYPYTITRETGLSIKNVYILLEHIANRGLIERNYEIYCCYCNKTDGIYRTIRDASEQVCSNCYKKILDKDIILIYQNKTQE